MYALYNTSMDSYNYYITQIPHHRDPLARPAPPLQIAWTPCVKRRDFEHELCFACSQFWPK